MSGKSSNERNKHDWQLNNLENNPCYKEHLMSLKCIDDNNYDLEMCQLHFENYKTCTKFWSAVKRMRRINGVKPYLPTYEERVKIKEKFLATGEI